MPGFFGKLLDFKASPTVKFLARLSKRIILFVVLPLALIALWLAAWAFWYEPSSLTVKNYELKISGWDPAHDGLKIVAISDIHGGSNFITEAKIRKLVELANAQNPDLIVLLGDYVSQQRFNRRELKMPIATIAANLRGFRAKHGVFAVLGNHDGWYSDPKIRVELERVGIRVLENEVEQLQINGTPLRILGLQDLLKAQISFDKYSQLAKNALGKAPSRGRIIALTHNPDVFQMTQGGYLISPDYVLMLAGHTHGGQVNFPFIGAPMVPSNLGQKYARGHVIENGVSLFVTPGVGTSILPVRFRVPPEISVLTISVD